MGGYTIIHCPDCGQVISEGYPGDSTIDTPCGCGNPLYDEIDRLKAKNNRLRTALKNTALDRLYRVHMADDAVDELKEEVGMMSNKPGPWFRVQGMITWDQTADWIQNLQNQLAQAEEERDKLKAELSVIVVGVSRTVFNLNSTLSLVTPHDDEPMAKQIHEDLSSIRDGLRALTRKALEGWKSVTWKRRSEEGGGE